MKWNCLFNAVCFGLALWTGAAMEAVGADEAGPSREGGARVNPSALLAEFDKDCDEALSRSEVPDWMVRPFDRIDADGDAKLSEDELRRVADRLARRRPGAGRGGEQPGVVVAPAARDERVPNRLRVGDVAPEFQLPDPSGKTEISLADLRRTKPVVLVFGSYTCPPFRRMSADVEKLYQAHKDRAEFLLVYIREAHPGSVLPVQKDERGGAMKKIEQTSDLESRSRHAEICRSMLNLSFPAVIDREDNKVNAAYAGWPIRLVIVDVDGKVAYVGGPGPGGFKTGDVGEWLETRAKAASEVEGKAAEKGTDRPDLP